MFSPTIAPVDSNRTRGRGRRTPAQPVQQTRTREGSISSTSAKPKWEESTSSSQRKSARDEHVKAKDKGAESVVWTRNSKYSVNLLPAIPDCLKSSGAILGAADSRYRHALVLNHTSAWVWNYDDPQSLPHTYLFMLPRDETPNRDGPYPLGTIVSPSANSEEPGLVVVMPLTGRIAYWEAVGTAAAEGLFAKKRGVEGRISLQPGESVTAICSIEPAGFILSLSSGRLAHLALRDTAGRPGCTTTMLRDTGFMSGLFGALRAGSHRREIVAIRAGRVGRMGDREVIVANARGGISKWYVERAGNFDAKPEIDLREAILRAVEKANPTAFRRHNRELFSVLDVAVAANGEINDDGETDLDCFVLAGFLDPAEDEAYYSVLEVTLKAGGRGEVKAVHPINCYTDPVEVSPHSRPRVYIPKPRNTAFVVFGRAVVILSNLKPNADGGRRLVSEGEMDVDRQLLEEEEEEERKAVFEDVIDFRGDVNINIVGSGGEDVLFETFRADNSLPGTGGLTRKKIGNPGVIMIARGGGVLRVEAYDVNNERKVKEAVMLPKEMMVKSKIEQAVFFGHIGKNPLNFSGRREVQFPIEDVERAAISISQEILSTSSTHITPELPSIEQHLQIRGQRLRALAEHLKATYPRLSSQVRWQLLEDAEKCEAARAVWQAWDERRDFLRPEDGSEEVLPEVVLKYNTTEQNMADSDAVRAWFLNCVGDIGNVIDATNRVVAEKAKTGRCGRLTLAQFIFQANDIVLSALEKAFDFRTRSASLYGFDGRVDSNGLLEASNNFAAPWTSRMHTLEALTKHHDITENILRSEWHKDTPAGVELPDAIVEQHVRLTELICLEFTERLRWSEYQESPDVKEEEAMIRERYLNERGGWVKSLIYYGQADPAYTIAEKYEDYRTLVELCSAEILQAEAANVETADEKTKLEAAGQKADAMKRLETYLQKFGEPFAFNLYEYKVETGYLQDILEQFKQFQPYLTKFLHSSDKYAKLAWIHDVSLGQYSNAGKTLIQIAHKQEDGLWNKKVELSIGKLCGLAALQDSAHPHESLQNIHRWTDGPLAIIQIQDQLYDFMQGTVRGAIDREAEIDLSMREKGSGLRRKPNMKEAFQQGLNLLFNNKSIEPELLIDTLTWLDGMDTRFLQFYLALKVLSNANLSDDRKRLAEQAIWRRCYIHDEWTSIVDMKRKTDEEAKEQTRHTALFTTMKECYKNSLFDEPSSVRPLSPQEALFSESVDDLRSRFKSSDDIELAAYANELAQENKTLNKYISKAKLSTWYEAVKVMAVEELKSRNATTTEEDEPAHTYHGGGEDIEMHE